MSFESILSQLPEVALHLGPYHQHRPAEAGPRGIVEGKLEQRFTSRSEAFKLLDAAVAAAKTGCQDDQGRTGGCGGVC